MANESGLFYNSITKDATISVTNSATGYGAGYLTDGILSTFYRSTGITEISITFDFGVVTAIDGVVLGNHNVEAGDTTYKFESSTNNFSTTSATKDLTLATRTVKQKNAAGTIENATRRDAYTVVDWNTRYYRVRIQKATGTYIEAAQVAIFVNNYTFAKNFIADHTVGIEGAFLETSGQYGQSVRNWLYSKHRRTVPFRTITTAQKDVIVEAGQSEQVVFLDGITSEIFWGALAARPPEYVRYTGAGAAIWNIDATFEETL